MRTGMKINNIIWGLRVSMMVVDCPKTPKLSLKYPRNIPISRSIGVYGILVFLLISLRRPPSKSPAKIKSTTKGPLWWSSSWRTYYSWEGSTSYYSADINVFNDSKIENNALMIRSESQLYCFHQILKLKFLFRKIKFRLINPMIHSY